MALTIAFSSFHTKILVYGYFADAPVSRVLRSYGFEQSLYIPNRFILIEVKEMLTPTELAAAWQEQKKGFFSRLFKGIDKPP